MSAITTPPTNIYRAPLNITDEHVCLGGSWSRHFPEPDVHASHWLRLRIHTWDSTSTLEWHVTNEKGQVRHWAAVAMYSSTHPFLDETFQTCIRRILKKATIIRRLNQHMHPGDLLIGATDGSAGKDGAIQSD